jgi:hypothetical protein
VNENQTDKCAESSGLMGPTREKYWEEMSIEQKISKCGEVIEALYRRNCELEKEIMLMSKHSHSQDGSILVPIKDKEYALERGRCWSPLNRQVR